MDLNSLDYNIKLNITSIASELKSSDLKYVLLKDNTIVKEGNFSTMVVGANTIYSNSISSSGTTNFTFYLYIDGNSENNLNMMNKLYLVLMVISLFSISCSKNISDDTSEIMEYDKLFSKYGWENVEKCERLVSSQKFESYNFV